MARSPASPASPALPAAADPRVRTRPRFASNLLRSLRPSQWIKNLLVFAGLIFGEKLGDPVSVGRASLAFVVFCLLSSAIYLINDVLDRDADRRHPVKSRRPIASGAISPATALTTATILLVLSLAGAFAINLAFGLVASSYVVLQALYSLSLKHVVILDVITLAGGFVLRAYGGAVAINVAFSHWLLLLTLLLALFLGLSKRRAELSTLADEARDHRRSLAHYSPYLLDQMIGVVTASTLLAYAFYTISPETVQKFHTDRLLLTVPFPLYGIFRYLYLVHQRDGGGNPSEMLLTDVPLLVCVALWAAAVIVILYTSWL
jgi:4-hydroxybenzoate polyprenyltransferase